MKRNSQRDNDCIMLHGCRTRSRGRQIRPGSQNRCLWQGTQFGVSNRVVTVGGAMAGAQVAVACLPVNVNPVVAVIRKLAVGPTT